MSTKRRIAKNASVLMGSQLITWGLTLLLTVSLTRHLGPEGIGIIHLASSIWAIVGMFITFGMDIYLTKEIARTPEKAAQLFSTTLLLRIPLYIIGLGMITVYASVAPEMTQEKVLVIYVIGASQLIWQLTYVARSTLEGLERMEYTSIADVASKMVYTGIILALIYFDYGLLPIASVVTLTALTYFIVVIVPLQRIQPLQLYIDWASMKEMLRSSIPYLIVTMLLVLYVQMDVVVMKHIVKDDTILGWYSAADKLFGTLLFIPTVFITAIFPVLSRMFKNGADNMAELIQNSFNLLLLLSVPIGFGLMMVAEPVVVLLFGDEFVNSGPILSVLGIVLLLMYQNILLGRFLVSTDRQNTWTWVMGIAVLMTIALDFVLVPLCQQEFGNGAIGGAIAYVVTEGFMMLTGLWLLRDLFSKSNIWFAVRTLIAGGIMSGTVWFVRDFPLAIPILVGGVIYLTFILLFRLVPVRELITLVQTMLKQRSSAPTVMNQTGD